MSASGTNGDAAPGRAMTDRRAFLVGAAGLGAAIAAHAAGARALGAQQAQNFAPMQQDAYRPTIRPAKPDAAPKLTDDERDALEHKLKCQCSCILDVYTCRTTDFTCSVSPAMHRDVMRLVAGGYDAQEIMDAFVETYGEVALTAPKKEGFNWAGYFAPAIAMASGAVALTFLLRKWAGDAALAREARAAAAAHAPAQSGVPGVSESDLARLERALREDA